MSSEHSIPWEANSRPACQESLSLFGKPNIKHHVHDIPSLIISWATLIQYTINFFTGSEQHVLSCPGCPLAQRDAKPVVHLPRYLWRTYTGTWWAPGPLAQVLERPYTGTWWAPSPCAGTWDTLHRHVMSSWSLRRYLRDLTPARDELLVLLRRYLRSLLSLRCLLRTQWTFRAGIKFTPGCF